MYTTANICAPNNSQSNFLHSVLKTIQNVHKGLLLLCGDFIAIVDSALSSSTRGNLQAFLHKTDLYNVWRCLNLNESDYTFFSTIIDLFVADLPTLNKISEARIHSITWLDHAPISIVLEEIFSASQPTSGVIMSHYMSKHRLKMTCENTLRTFFLLTLHLMLQLPRCGVLIRPFVGDS